MKRLQPLDILRGFSILYVVFIHGAIYNFDAFSQIDIDSLPLYLLVIGAVGLWGGIFVVYSLIVNTVKLLGRIERSEINFRQISHLVIAGLVYLLILGTIQSLLLGRWAIESDTIQLTAIAELIRGQDMTVHFDKLFTSSGLKIIGLNLIIAPLVIYAALRRTGLKDRPDSYQLFFGLGLTILGFSFLRIFLYPDWIEAMMNGNWMAGLAGGLVLADPYPGIAYSSYGMFGVGLGLILYYRRLDYLRRYVLPLGLILVAVGSVANSLTTASFFGPSWFWYGKIVLETGIFLLLFCLAIWIELRGVSVRSGFWQAAYRLLGPASRISLTIYLFETLTSELLRLVFSHFAPDWPTSVTACLLLGAVNLIVWLSLAHVWQRYNYRYSIEYLWVVIWQLFGRKSTKLKYN